MALVLCLWVLFLTVWGLWTFCYSSDDTELANEDLNPALDYFDENRDALPVTGVAFTAVGTACETDWEDTELAMWDGSVEGCKNNNKVTAGECKKVDGTT